MTANEWNAKYPVGTRVRYFPTKGNLGEFTDTRTRGAAWHLSSGQVIVPLEGFSGGKSIEHCSPLDPARAP